MRNNKINQLRELMRERGITVYIIPTSDYHQSEYISGYFKTRQFLTGFTGSAGTAVVTMDEACLWTDGRYFIQAERELEGSEIRLFKMGMEGVPDIKEYVEERMNPEACIGFDGKVLCAQDGMDYAGIAEDHNASVRSGEDLVGMIWKDRPAFPCSSMFVLEEKYAGKSTAEKLKDVRKKMSGYGAEVHVLSDACDIAWLLNIRGADISHVPVVLSFVLMDMENCFWYVNREKLNEEVCRYLSDNHIIIKDYNDIYSDVEKIKKKMILADLRKINYKLRCSADTDILDYSNPEELMKSMKNPVEIENIRNAHIKDGVAVTKFMYWLKNTIGRETITEMDAARHMDELRAGLEHYVDISFDTIAAYGSNAAMMHYKADETCNTVLEPKGFLLVDSGGHYLEGSTDITRTFALGEISEEEKLMFTAVVRGNLNLADAKFLYGCSGLNLDILAREPLWQLGMDYRCGTGHGNGYLLNVHEGPNSFRWRKLPGVIDDIPVQEGMITTDEPGVYEEGRYGIRIENELLCKKGVKNEYGQFMEFENITYAPIDLDAIDAGEMTGRERKLLNDYHKKVYEVISPYLNDAEKKWLQEYTREI